ncbi:M24 family metallopeptidase [Mycoplana dimorpha]|uniref:Xaa-Pro aminopeptidase n=2 Tax=Mycoplana dimorpha TaxID=28320 RepID=A0A2T5AQV3_MYCDI|nr:Xaa-Pro aminopeptidase [Mycoplana dimorpha]
MSMLPPGVLARMNRDRVVALGGTRDLLYVAAKLPNVVYCSGYRSSAYDTDPDHRMAVVFDSENMVVVGPVADLWGAAECASKPFIYMGYRRFFFDHTEALIDGETRFEQYSSFDSALNAAIARLSDGKTRIAFDTDPTAFDLASTLPLLSQEDADRVFRTARSVKSAAEISLLRSATEITEQALSTSLANARSGVSEADVAADITASMIRNGIRPGFVVVTSGPRAALADAYASRRILRPGDVVRIDIGGTFGGYWSDTACTAVVGEPSDEIEKVSAALLAGQAVALGRVLPGSQTAEIFHATISAVCAAGLPQYRRHHVGHGLGLAPHEFPTIGPDKSERLVPGMVINVETPYYRPGWGGIMYEDTLVVGEGGAKRLTTLDNRLIILPD